MIILSGGARGSDELFGTLGIPTLVMSFNEHKSCINPKIGRVVKINDASLMNVIPKYKALCRKIKVNETNSDYILKLMCRNYYQIHPTKNIISDCIIAICDIKNNKVEGGTGYTIEIAKEYKLPIIILNKSDCIFYEFNYISGIYEKLPSAIDISKFNYITGIGSREIYDIHKTIIRFIFKEYNINNEEVSNYVREIGYTI